MSVPLLRPSLVAKSQSVISLRAMSTVPAERKADFASRDISVGTFPDVKTLALRRGTGQRSSFNGIIATIFGASGFLGRSVVTNLGKNGCQCILPYRGDPYSLRERKLAGDLGQILFTPYYMRDLDSVVRALKHSNVVINLVGRNMETPNFDLQEVNVEWPRTLGRLCREAGVSRLIHVSALNSSPTPEEHYIKGGSKWLRTKYEGELAIRDEYPGVTIFRPADMYGEVDNLLWYYCLGYRRKLRRLPLPNGGYGITKTPVFVSDVAQGIYNSISDEGSIGKNFDAVGPRRYELRMMLEYLQEIINKNPGDGFRITNLKWDLSFRLRLSLFTKIGQVWSRNPKISWERLERECFSDEQTDNPTLSDLGVRLQFIEEHWPDLLIPFRFDYSYEGDLGEKKLFTNPPFIVDQPARPFLA